MVLKNGDKTQCYIIKLIIESLLTMDFDNNSIIVALRYTMAITAIHVNFLVLFLVLKYLKSRKNLYNQLVIILSLSDIFMCFGSLLRSIFKSYAIHNELVLSKYHCYLASILPVSGINFQHSMLVALAVDRLLAISMPIKYLVGSFKYIPIIAIFFGIFFSMLYILGNAIGVNMSDRALICSLGGVRGEYGQMITHSISFTFIFCISATYLVTLVIFKKQRKSRFLTQEHKLQNNLFYNVSYIVIINCIVYGQPIVCYILQLTFDFSFTINLLSSIGVGFGFLITSNLNGFVYLFQHKKINQSFKILVGYKKDLNIVSVSKIPTW